MEQWERERRRKKKQRFWRKNHGKACFDSDFRMFGFKGRGVVFYCLLVEGTSLDYVTSNVVFGIRII
jgi:hypothetical protein